VSRTTISSLIIESWCNRWWRAIDNDFAGVAIKPPLAALRLKVVVVSIKRDEIGCQVKCLKKANNCELSAEASEGLEMSGQSQLSALGRSSKVTCLLLFCGTSGTGTILTQAFYTERENLHDVKEKPQAGTLQRKSADAWHRGRETSVVAKKFL